MPKSTKVFFLNRSLKKILNYLIQKLLIKICLKNIIEMNQRKLVFYELYCFLTPFLTKCSGLDIIVFRLKLTSATLAFHPMRPCEFQLSLERILLLIPSHSHWHWWSSSNPTEWKCGFIKNITRKLFSFHHIFLWKSTF